MRESKTAEVDTPVSKFTIDGRAVPVGFGKVLVEGGDLFIAVRVSGASKVGLEVRESSGGDGVMYAWKPELPVNGVGPDSPMKPHPELAFTGMEIYDGRMIWEWPLPHDGQRVRLDLVERTLVWDDEAGNHVIAYSS